MSNIATPALNAHQLAAAFLRQEGYNAQCVKNEACHQPYQVNVQGITCDKAKQLQEALCLMFKCDILNIVENEVESPTFDTRTAYRVDSGLGGSFTLRFIDENLGQYKFAVNMPNSDFHGHPRWFSIDTIHLVTPA